MAKTIWMDELADLAIDGEIACFTLASDGRKVTVRCKRHVALSAIKFAERRYCEIERSERKARVVPIGKR